MWPRGCKTRRPIGRSVTETHRARRTVLEGPAEEGESPVVEVRENRAVFLSTAGHEKSGRKLGRPLPKAKYLPRPIVDKYREGKVKSTPGGE